MNKTPADRKHDLEKLLGDLKIRLTGAELTLLGE